MGWQEGAPALPLRCERGYIHGKSVMAEAQPKGRRLVVAALVSTVAMLGCSSAPPCEDALTYIRDLHCAIPPAYQRDPYARMCDDDVLRSCISGCVLRHHPSCRDLYPSLDPNSPVDSPAYSGCTRACIEHD